MGDKNAKVKISGPEARAFLEKLATNDSFRAEVEADPQGELDKAKIEVSGDIPNTVTLPSKQKIRKFIDDEVATVPDATTGAVLGWAVLYVVLGAMPIVARGEPAGDAAG